MPEHRIGTREEWQAARDELAKLEAEQAERNEEVKRKRLDLPWVPVEKEYEFDTEDGKKTLAELFEGRSQLLAYNIMFGPDYTLGACPGCTSLGDGLDGSLVHLNHRDVTLLCFSRAPIERLAAYKRRMGWQFPYVSTHSTDFAFDFGLALTEETRTDDDRVGLHLMTRRCRREGLELRLVPLAADELSLGRFDAAAPADRRSGHEHGRRPRDVRAGRVKGAMRWPS